MFYLNNTISAVIVFIIACITDIVDGIIARRFNMVTDLGKILDPLADKGMQVTVLFSMAVKSLIPWIVVAVIICKEFLMLAGGTVLYASDIVISSNVYGKLSTVVTSSCVILILLFNRCLSATLLTVLQWLPVVFAFIALIGYFNVWYKIKNNKDSNSE